MRKNHLIMLVTVFATLLASSYWQHYVSANRPGALLAYTVWLACDVIAIWAIAAIGRIRAHEPDKSPLEFGGLFLFLLGAIAIYGVGSNTIGRLAAAFLDPVLFEQIEQARQVHDFDVQTPTLSAFMTLIAAPVTEEIIFRVGILGVFLLFMRKPYAIVAASAAFAIAHLDV